MTNKEIKKLSRKLIKSRIPKSLSILFLTLISIVFFTLMPYSIYKFSDAFGLKAIADSISFYIYPSVLCVIMSAVALWAVCVYSSISLGERAWYTGHANQKNNCEKRLFFWFKPKSSVKAFKFSITLFCVKLVWSLIFLSPTALILLAIYILSSTGGIEVYLLIPLTAGGILSLLSGLVFRFIFLQRYFLAKYLIASNPKLGAIQAIKQSKNLLEGHLLRIVSFKISFFPWFILSSLIVPIFFTYPYYKQSCSVIAKAVCL